MTSRGVFSVTPDRFLELLFFDRPPFVESGNSQLPLPGCVLIGLLRRPLRLHMTGEVLCVSARLHAWSAGLLFPDEACSAGWSDQSARFGDARTTLIEHLRQGRWDQLAPCLDALLRRSVVGPLPSQAPIAAAFVGSPGQAGRHTDEVAASASLSRRQVERQVRATTHRSPKQLSSLSRFQWVRDALWHDPDQSLGELALEAGYADQAHMTRHFHEFAQQTPTAFLREAAQLKAYLRGEDVAFLQESPEGAP